MSVQYENQVTANQSCVKQSRVFSLSDWLLGRLKWHKQKSVIVYVAEHIPDLTSCLVSLLAGEREESESEAVPGGAQLSVYGNITFRFTDS